MVHRCWREMNEPQDDQQTNKDSKCFSGSSGMQGVQEKVVGRLEEAQMHCWKRSS